MPTSPRILTTSAVALAVLTAGLTVAVVQAKPAGAVVVVTPDVSLTPGRGVVSTVSPEIAVRPGASDVPRVYPLSIPFRTASHNA